MTAEQSQASAIERALTFCYALLAPGQDANAIIAASPDRAREAHRAIYERKPHAISYDSMMAAYSTPAGAAMPDDAEIVGRVKTLPDVIAEAKRVQRLVQGCLECNAGDERRWSETIDWLAGLA